MSDTVYIIIIAELLFVCGFCGYLIIKLRQRLQRLTQRLSPASSSGTASDPTDPSVIAFIVSQLKATRGLPETDLGKALDLNPLITTVRCAYLNAERRALKQPENSKEYWLVLRDEINKVIGILSTEAKRTGAENTQLKEKLKLLRERLEKLGDNDWVAGNANLAAAEGEQPGYVLRFNRGLDTSSQSASKASRHGLSLFNKLEQQKQHTQKLTHMLKQEQDQSDLEMKVAQYERMLYKMEHESAALQKSLNDAKKQLAHVDKAFNSPNPTDEQTRTLLSVIRASREGSDKSENPFEDLLKDSHALSNQSRKNLDGLQKTIVDQRKSILSMESTIAQLESELAGNKEGNDAKRSELDKLKRALMESETCIQVLENEVENLYNHLQELQKQREELQEHYKDVEDDKLLATIESEREQDQLEKHMQQMVNSSLNAGFLTEFMTNAIESGSLEDLITVLQHAVTEMGFQSIIRLQVGNNKVDIASLGKLSKEDKMLIDRLEFDANAPIQSKDKRVTLHMRSARAILKFSKAGEKLADNQKQYLEALFNFSSNLAAKVAAQKDINKRLDSFEYFNEMLQTISANMEAQYRYQREETQSIIQSIVDQSHMLVGEKATPGQQSVLQAMEDEAKQRTDLLDANRAIVRKQFVKMLEKLESGKA